MYLANKICYLQITSKVVVKKDLKFIIEDLISIAYELVILIS